MFSTAAISRCPRLSTLWTQVNSVKVLCSGTFYRHLSDFQKKKILGEFDSLYDRNKDGFVDKSDIDSYKKDLSDYYANTRGHISRTADPGFDDYWILFKEVADANKDGRLSREEWLDIWTQINYSAPDRTFRSLPQWVRFMPGVVFPIIDVKGDGLVDVEEYTNFWFKIGGFSADDNTIRKVFDVMTEKGTVQLNLQRFQELYADFYFSIDTSSAGKYMAGPVEYN